MFSFLNNSNTSQHPELTQAGTVPCGPVDPNQRPRDCHVCGWTPPFNADLPRHFKEMHSSDAKRLCQELALDLYPLPNNIASERTFDCRICHKDFTRLFSLLRHQRSDHAAVAAELESEISDRLFDSQFPRQPASQPAILQFAEPQPFQTFTQPAYGRTPEAVDDAEDLALTPTVDVRFADLQLVTPQPAARHLANLHFKDEDAEHLFLDSGYVAPQPYVTLSLPPSVIVPTADSDDAEDLALTPDMDISFEDLPAKTNLASIAKPVTPLLVTESIEVPSICDDVVMNNTPRVLVRFSGPSPVQPRPTIVRKNGKAPAAKATASKRKTPYQSHSEKSAADSAAADKQKAAAKEQQTLRVGSQAADTSTSTSTSTATSAKSHKKSTTTKPMLFKCDALGCDREFINIVHLRHHIRLDHFEYRAELNALAREQKPWPCLVVCEMMFQTRKLRHEHLYAEHQDWVDEDKANLIENSYQDAE